MPLSSPFLLATAALAALALAPAAHADSVIFVEDGNVVAASPDGATKRLLTDNGKPDSSYRSPSADDSGRWIAAREGIWYWHAPDGALLSADMVDKGRCESLNTGPTAGRLDPSGDFVAFESMCSGFAGQSITTRVVINFTGNPTIGNAPVLEGYRQPTWMGRRLVVDGGNGTFVQDDTPEAPVSTAFSGWLSGPTERAEISRDRRMALISVGEVEGNPPELWLARLDADPPAGVPTAACKVPIQGAASRGSFSPDGTRIVWRDDRGIVVARTYAVPPSGTEQVGPCAEEHGPPTVLSATGNEPSFTPADLHLAAGTTPGTGPEGQKPDGKDGNGGQGGQGAARTGELRLTVGASVRLRALRKGMVLRVTAPAVGSGRVQATVSAKAAKALGLRGTRTVASASFSALAPGAVSVRLKPARKVAGRLARLRRLPVTFAVSFTPEGGTQQRTSAKRTLR